MSYHNQTPAEAASVRDLPFAPAMPTAAIETFLLSSLVKRHSDAELNRHQRVQFELFVQCLRGDGHHEVDFEPVIIRPGQVLAVRAGQVHRWIIDQPHEARLFLVRPVKRRNDRAPHSHVMGPNDDLTYDLHRIAELLRPNRTFPLSASGEAALRELLITITEQATPVAEGVGTYASLVHAFEDLILSGRPPIRSVGHYASKLSCSTRTLERACHDIAGESPKTLIDQAIALEAERRLAVGGSSVVDIATELGFSEVSNFSRFFHRVTRRSPTEFLASLA